MVTFRKNNNNRRGSFRRNDRSFKSNNDRGKFSSNFSNGDNFQRKIPGRNNHNASNLIDKYNDEKLWIYTVNNVSKNILRYTKIRKQAYHFARYHNLDWRVKKILNIIANYKNNF